MIERAIAILQDVGYDLTARELADILWLAVKMKPLSAQSPHQITEPLTQLPTPKPDPSNKPVDTSKPEVPKPRDTSGSSDKEPTAPVVLPPPPSEPKPPSTDNTEAIPIKIPAAAALRNSLALGRALRPLMRKVPSLTEKILDEEATVQRFAEDEIGIPILKSTPERWLELALVVEETSITEIWEQTIREFQQLLKYQGAFRDVRTWKLKVAESIDSTSNQPKIQLFPENSTGFDESTAHKPDVLIDSQGRRLILLVSDCISPIWRKQLIHPILELWGKQGLITILQLLPERLWDRTALVNEIPVLLSTYAPGLYNSQLNSQLWDEDDIDEFSDKDKSKNLKSLTSIPIITLEPEPLLQWSKVIAGQGNILTAGFKFYSYYSHQQTNSLENVPPTTLQLSDSKNLNTEELLVNLFRANASLQARRLAGLMATVPVSISVVNLIRETLLPDAREIHIVEVFMSGMLKRLPLSQQDDTEYTYEFVDGVRELLRDFVPPDKQISVLDKVSEFIAKRLGISIKEFNAQLLTSNNNALASKLRSLAKLKAQVLRQLGGNYARKAEKLELNQFVQEYAGQYICAFKSGGETGTWDETVEEMITEDETRENSLSLIYLLISPRGEVQFGSQNDCPVIKNLTIEGKTLSWSFDGNQIAASITFKINSDNSYFWEQHQTGKLFEGWLKYPNEDIQKDFRGRLDETPPPSFLEFSFEVAVVVNM